MSYVQVEEVLGSVGFTEEMQQAPVASLSGGWKMKLALARAMLMKADIMLLDEPTNHLDVKNVAWLMDYLCSLTQVTSIIVSHDSRFLDRVCTGIIDYNNRKLKLYKVRRGASACTCRLLAAIMHFAWGCPKPLGVLHDVQHEFT